MEEGTTIIAPSLISTLLCFLFSQILTFVEMLKVLLVSFSSCDHIVKELRKRRRRRMKVKKSSRALYPISILKHNVERLMAPGSL